VKRTTDELLEYGLRVDVGAQQIVHNGQPVFNGDGSPKTVKVWTCTFVSKDGLHIVKIPLTEEGREALIAALHSGVIIAPSGVLPGNGGRS
jgi:hypothetical protein